MTDTYTHAHTDTPACRHTHTHHNTTQTCMHARTHALTQTHTLSAERERAPKPETKLTAQSNKWKLGGVPPEEDISAWTGRPMVNR